MIGLLFLLVIVLWAMGAYYLGTHLPRWANFRHRVLWAWVLVPVIFILPVVDEVIAYPQMRVLCASLKPYELAPGMDEKRAYGRTVDQAGDDVMETLWPSTVKVKRINVIYVDEKTREPILEHSWLVPIRGMLGVPNGSSGGTMTVLLSTCGPTRESYDASGFPTRFSHLKLTKISR